MASNTARIFLGLALLHRYRNKREGTRFQDLYDLIDEKTQLQAEIVGKAMRFGSMLWMQSDAQMAKMRWFPKKRLLELRLTKAAVPLYGEVPKARFLSLASSLGAEVCVKIAR